MYNFCSLQLQQRFFASDKDLFLPSQPLNFTCACTFHFLSLISTQRPNHAMHSNLVSRNLKEMKKVKSYIQGIKHINLLILTSLFHEFQQSIKGSTVWNINLDTNVQVHHQEGQHIVTVHCIWRKLQVVHSH